MDNNRNKVQQCFWQDGNLVIVTAGGQIQLSGTDGVRALKENRVSLPERQETSTDEVSAPQEIPLFEPDDPRRMAMIQDRISSLRD